MIDVLLTSPPSRMDNHYRPPLSLMYVAGFYQSKGLNVHILDYPFRQVIRTKKFWNDRPFIIENVRKKMLHGIMELKPRMIGISCYSTEFEEVKKLIHEIRKVTSSSIIIGGIHPTLKPDDFKGIVEYCIQGRLDNGLPAYELVNMEHYSHANPYAIRGVFLRCAYVLASFGCPSQCTFCVAKGLMKHYKTIQFKEPHALYKEVKYLKDTYAIDGFYIIDDLYTSDKKKVMEFCSLIKKENLLWGCSSKVTTINEELVRNMAQAGCVQIDFGIERGSNEALKQIKKGITIEKAKEAIRLCKKHRIRVLANFLVGLPKESEEDRRDIETFISETRPEVVALNKFTPYVGTELYEQGSKEDTSREVEEFILKGMKKFNSVWVNIRWALTWRYIRTLLFSKRKTDYWRQLWLLIGEVRNQKY